MGLRRYKGLSHPERVKLDRLARRVVMLRAGAVLFTDQKREQWWGPCGRCHKEVFLSWCHVFTRATWATRWAPDNAFAACNGCHMWLDQHWESKRLWTIERIGEETYSAMEMRTRLKSGRTDYAAVRVALEQEIKKFGVSFPEAF